MLRTQYHVTNVDGVTQSLVTGYLLCVSGLDFGVHKQKSTINSDVFWIVTEIRTGLRLPYNYTTRKEAVSSIKALMPKIKKTLKALNKS